MGLDFTSTLGVVDTTYSFIWLIFALFIGIALAADVGVLDKPKRFFKNLHLGLITTIPTRTKGQRLRKKKKRSNHLLPHLKNQPLIHKDYNK